MTIYLSHTAAVAYSLLAAAVNNVCRNPNSDDAKGALMVLDDEIQRQVGVLHHEQVCASPEYARLLQLHADKETTHLSAAQRVLEARWFNPATVRL